MIINFSIQAQENQPTQYAYLRLTLPSDFSRLEIKQIFSFLKKYFRQKYGRAIKPVHKIPSAAKADTKKIDLRHFFNYLSVVEIREGIQDADFDYDLSGLRGQILLFLQDGESELYFIQWTHESFLRISDQYRFILKNNDLPWSGTFIESYNILPVSSAKTLEPIDLVLASKYLKTLPNKHLNFWEKEIIPLLAVYPSIFSIWEQLFSGIQNPIQLTYHVPGLAVPPITAAFHLTPAGNEPVNGVWVTLSEEAEIMLPLTEISNFSDPDLQQKLSYYHDWVRFVCPKL